jgi:hypothetical protein
MNGRTHAIYGTGLVFLIFTFLVWFAYGHTAYEYPSLLAFGVGAIFGTLFPDFDFIIGNGSPKHHRSTLTHSAILPICVTLSYAFSPNLFARTLLMFISFGLATHLFFDLFISSVPKQFKGNIISRWGYRIASIISGKVGGSFKGYYASFANKHKILWLTINGLLCVVCGLVLLFLIYKNIQFDWWFR